MTEDMGEIEHLIHQNDAMTIALAVLLQDYTKDRPCIVRKIDYEQLRTGSAARLHVDVGKEIMTLYVEKMP